MEYTKILNLTFFIYLVLYIIIEHIADSKIKNINIEEKLSQALKREKLDDVTLNIKSGNKPSYQRGTKVISIGDKQTLKQLAHGFHELGHAIVLKGEDFKKGNILSQFLITYYYNAYLLGIACTAVFSLIKTMDYGTFLLIQTTLLIGVINLVLVLREEYQASKIGYMHLKREATELTRDDNWRVVALMTNSFSSYLFFFLLTLGTLLYNLN